MSLDEFLTVAEVADRLRLNQQTIRNWIDRGALRAVRVGPRRVRVRRVDLERFITESSMPGPTDEDSARQALAARGGEGERAALTRLAKTAASLAGIVSRPHPTGGDQASAR